MRVAIIGGGIAGMSAAWELEHRGIDYTLIESADRLGGKVRTELIHGYGDKPFVVEIGPDAFLTRKPWLVELANELGIDTRFSPVQKQRHSIYVLSQGKPVPMPKGLQLLVPTDFWALLQSPLFSPWGKLRMLTDWFIPPRLESADESLAQFVTRRLGKEVLDKLGDPLLAGVYNAEAECQSILATFPQFPALEREYGSLIRGMRAKQRNSNEDNQPALISFETGSQEIVDAVATRLTGDVRLNTKVTGITGFAGQYQIMTDHGILVEADALIVAVPANIAAAILTEIAPRSAEQLREIRFAGVGSMSLAFRREDVAHPLDGIGLVIPSSEKCKIDGITWSSSKWAHAAPEGYTLLRVFFGGPHTRDTLDLDDAALLMVVHQELQSILGITSEPLFYRAYRWHDGYPQYDIGHQERVASIKANLPKGIELAGNSYYGVGVPDTIHHARLAARKVAAELHKSQGEKWTA
jgi:protoporphyrinogen/coproporphyrinogen III oxidase